jgi:hypothetical protein
VVTTVSAPPFAGSVPKRKLPGALGEPPKNAPAIANVRVQDARRKKKFIKIQKQLRERRILSQAKLNNI